jgi:hypothetical protein
MKSKKNVIKTILLFLMLAITILGCKKDDDNSSASSSITLKGSTWKITSGDEKASYIYFGEDDILYFLDEYQYKLKGYWGELCEIDEEQKEVILDEEEYYNYTIVDQTLTLSATDYNYTIIGTYLSNGPTNKTWADKNLTLLQSMNAPKQECSDITFDGQYLWYGAGCDYDNDPYLYKINISNLTVQEQLPTSNWAQGIEWVSGYLWTSNNGSETIYKVDPNNGTNLFESISMGAWIPGIAYDGQFLWCNSGNEKTIYKYDYQNDFIASEINFDIQYGWIELSGSTYYDGFLYVISTGIINKCNVNNFEAIESYSLNNDESIIGITHDGNNFWISTRYWDNNNQQSIYKIHKVSM